MLLAPTKATAKPRAPSKACYAHRIVHYAKFVESLKDAEEAPGCEHCSDNRLLLEHAWQVVANEFYDPAGHFSQAKWADQLLRTFKVIIRLLLAPAMSSKLPQDPPSAFPFPLYWLKPMGSLGKP